MRRLLLVDKTPEYFEPLLPGLSQRYDVRLCCKGRDLLAELLAFRPDLLVFDSSLPDCDPAGILRVAQAMDIRPRSLALAYIPTDLPSKELFTFLLIKPFEPEELLKRIGNMEQLLIKNRPERLYTLTGSIMQELGVQQNLTGFACLQIGAIYLYDHEDCLFTDELYPYIAKQVQGSAASVEKAMSRSIESSWKKRTEPVWRYYFENTDRCPTNVRFLKTLVKAVKEAF